jgi:hypothetical protein
VDRGRGTHAVVDAEGRAGHAKGERGILAPRGHIIMLERLGDSRMDDGPSPRSLPLRLRQLPGGPVMC